VPRDPCAARRRAPRLGSHDVQGVQGCRGSGMRACVPGGGDWKGGNVGEGESSEGDVRERGEVAGKDRGREK
jgi:hypothetical protein